MIACGLGMQLLVHFWAIGEKKLNVINGNEKGGLLSEIDKFKSAQILKSLTPDSVFLDHATGDFYQFDKYTLQWMPKGNVGMHYAGAIEKGTGEAACKTGAGLVKKTLIYRSQALSSEHLFL